jgi:hypothetical protein
MKQAQAGTCRNVGFQAMKKKFSARRGRRGFGILEAVIAGVFIVSLSFAVALMAVDEQDDMVVQDTQSSMADELLRQSEIVRTLPMTGTNSVVGLMPITTGTGIGASTSYTPTGVDAPLPLNGYMVSTLNATSITPTVTWQRTRLAPQADIPVLLDQIVITASILRLGIHLKNSTTVYRVFDGQGS